MGSGTCSRLAPRFPSPQKPRSHRAASPSKGLGHWLGPCHLSTSGLEARVGEPMTHYVAIVEDAGPDKAVGVWFPDLPGCFSAGDDVDAALRNAEEALSLYAEALRKDGRT